MPQAWISLPMKHGIHISQSLGDYCTSTHQKNDIRLRRTKSTRCVDDIYTCGVDDIRALRRGQEENTRHCAQGNAGHEV